MVAWAHTLPAQSLRTEHVLRDQLTLATRRARLQTLSRDPDPDAALCVMRSPYVFGVHVDELANNGKGGPDTVEVIDKRNSRTARSFGVARVWTAAWPVVVP